MCGSLCVLYCTIYIFKFSACHFIFKEASVKAVSYTSKYQPRMNEKSTILHIVDIFCCVCSISGPTKILILIFKQLEDKLASNMFYKSH